MNLNDLVSPSPSPLITTICADGGLGKTTLASLWPSPVFIRTENGSKAIEVRKDVAMFPVAQHVRDVMSAVESLIMEDHDFRTLVVDSVTQFDTIAKKEILAKDPKAQSINQALGGYGAGIEAVANIHRELRDALGFLSDMKGMHIVFIAHADIETIDLPDQDQFSRYTIRMNKKCIAPYTDNVDLIAFIKLQTFTSGDGDKKKATTTGQRIITCYPHPSHVSKNRLGIESDLVFEKGVNPFIKYL